MAALQQTLALEPDNADAAWLLRMVTSAAVNGGMAAPGGPTAHRSPWAGAGLFSSFPSSGLETGLRQAPAWRPAPERVTRSRSFAAVRSQAGAWERGEGREHATVS